MAKRGRRPKGEYPEKKRIFASRMREDTWAKLKEAAAKSGRSISQEFEHRLRRGLDEDEKIEETFGDQRTYALMKLAAQAINSRPNLTNQNVHWTADPVLFTQALDLMAKTLSVLQPRGIGVTPEIGAPVLEMLQEAKAADPARPLNRSTRRHRAMVRLKDQLGELVARAGDRRPGESATEKGKRPKHKLPRA
jgi:hypothetical protein